MKITLSKSQILLTQIAVKMVRVWFIENQAFYGYIKYLPINYLKNVVGDSAPNERQVSPDKLYRAAVLKNRFADTILKAREKTLAQVHLKFELLEQLNLQLTRGKKKVELTLHVIIILIVNSVCSFNLIWLRSG